MNNLLRHAQESFDDQRLGIVAVAMREINLSGKVVDLISVLRYLEDPEKLSLVNGDFVRPLLSESVPLALAEEDAQTLWENYRVRKQQSVLAEGLEAMTNCPAQAPRCIHPASRASRCC
jgi:hypothetical protein